MNKGNFFISLLYMLMALGCALFVSSAHATPSDPFSKPEVVLRLLSISTRTAAAEMDWLTLSLLLLCFVMLSGVCLAMLYSIVRFGLGSKVRRTQLEPQTYTLEIAWTLVPVFLFFGLFAWGSWLSWH